MATDTSPNPRWKQLIADGIAKGFKEGEKTSVLYYPLATVTPGTPPQPHVRYVVHRGFVNEQRSKESKSGVEPFHKDFGSSVCLLTTTDVRAPKVQQMVETAKQGGANGEISWWMESSQLQFRISGVFHLLPTPSHPLFKNFPKERLSPPPASSSSSSKAFDWAQERSRVFEKLSPGLLASFARPIPGSDHPKASELNGGPGEGGEGKDDKNSPWPLELPAPGKEENEEQKKLLVLSPRRLAALARYPVSHSSSSSPTESIWSTWVAIRGVSLSARETDPIASGRRREWCLKSRERVGKQMDTPG